MKCSELGMNIKKQTMKILRKKVTMIVEKTDTGFSAYSEQYSIFTTAGNIFTTAGNIFELMNNALEAVNLYLEEDGMRATHRNIRFEIDFKQFFQYYRIVNVKFLAEKIGMNPTLLSQYVQGHKKPSLTQTEKILTGLHQTGQELSEINLIHQ